MDYDKRYRLQSAPQARRDGSGCVDHDIFAEYRAADSEDGWQVVPGRHKTFSVPADELSAALESGTNSQKATAYKQVLAAYVQFHPVPISGWGTDALESLLDANDRAQAATTTAQEFIAVVKPDGYPVWFTIK